MATAEFRRFKKLLQDTGHFVTMPRMRLFAVLQKKTALTLKELIKHSDRYDQATVYRNVDLFERLGIINRVQLGWHTKIELSDIFQHHHHHMTCVNCGEVSDLHEDSVIEHHIVKLAKENGFEAMDHQLEIRGLCRSCQRHRKSSDFLAKS